MVPVEGANDESDEQDDSEGSDDEDSEDADEDQGDEAAGAIKHRSDEEEIDMTVGPGEDKIEGLMSGEPTVSDDMHTLELRFYIIP